MMMNFLKTIFYFLVCIPIIFIGLYFFVNLCRTNAKINSVEKAQHDELVREQMRKKSFDKEYSKTHHGEK